MTLQTIRDALTAICLDAVPGAKVVRYDAHKPVARPSIRIDLYSADSGALCEGARERGAEVDLFYYPPDDHKPLTNGEAVGEALNLALYGGFAAGGTWVHPADDMTTDFSDGVLSVQFTAEWMESMDEDGEPMETLIYNNEEVVNDGNNDAEN